jgi:hypothetical protein
VRHVARVLAAAAGVALAISTGWAPATASGQESTAPASLPPVAMALTPAGPDWLQLVNAYRGAAGLPPVGDEPSWTPSVAAHADYTVRSGMVSHRQNPSLPGASAAGDVAARNSVLSYWTDSRDDRTLVEMWVAGPFHLAHIIEPRLQRVAFASARDVPGSRGGSAAVLDIGRGRGPRVSVSDAVLFPGPGASVPIGTFVAENPDPLTHCPGYRAPAGLPVLALLPNPPGRDLAATVATGGQPLESCVIGPDYRNPRPAAQASGRATLTEKNAVIVVPRSPLEPGRTYDVTLRSGGRSWAWSFRVGLPGTPVESARPLIVSPRTR